MKSFASFKKIAWLNLVAGLLVIVLVFSVVPWTAFAAGLPQEIQIPLNAVKLDDGITVTPSPTPTYDLTEAAGLNHTRTFSVVLNTRPSDDVVVSIANSGVRTSLDKTSLTFTAINWNTPQDFTVTAVDNLIADGNASASVDLSLSSADPIYNAHFATTIQFNVVDNDVAGIIISPNPALTYDLTEAAGANHTRTFSVKLTSEPTANVVVQITNPSVRTSLDKTSLTFTSATWNTPQDFTVTAVDNLIADGNALVAVNLSLTSADLVYHNKFAAVISINVIDDDPGLIISPDQTLTYDLTEATGANHAKTFSVVLNTEPAEDVVVSIANPGVRTSLDKTSLTFTAVNWNTPQDFTVTAIDNLIADGNVSASVDLSLSSADPIYNAHFATTIQFNVVDNDVAGIIISPNPALTYDLTEAAGANHTRTFSVKLTSQPTADVVVQLANPGVRTSLDKPSLTFTSATWNTPQDFTVTAVDNLIADGNALVAVNLSLSSVDPIYNAHFAATIQFNAIDNDTAGIIVSPDSTVTYDLTEAAEANHTQTFSVKLTSEPTANVVVQLANPGVRTLLDKTSLTFTAVNWNTPQDFTVTAVDNLIADGNALVSINLSLTSADPTYGAHFATAVQLNVIDNDVAGVTIAPDSTVTYDLTEAAGGNHSRIFTVALNSQPTADVVIHIANATARTELDKTSLTFTAVNWNITQSFTVTGMNNLIADGDVLAAVNLSLTSTDLVYHNKFGASLKFNVMDNDEAGITIAPDPAVSYALTEAAGANHTRAFTAVLTSQPTADVTVHLVASNARGEVNKASLTFTAANWSTTQEFIVTGVDNAIADGPAPVSVDLNVTSTDGVYHNKFATALQFTVSDNDVANLNISPNPNETYNLTEAPGVDNAKTFSVVLNSQPTANVVISITKSSPRILVDKTSLTFTAANWNTTQNFTVTAYNDNVPAGELLVTIDIALASNDSGYNAQFATTLSINIIDATPGLVISPDPSLTYQITEAPGNTPSKAYSIKLSMKPTATVVVTPANTSGRITWSPATLTFTPGNWNTNQTFTVSAVDNTIADGDAAVQVGLTLVSTDVQYGGLIAPSLMLRVIDNDTPGIRIDPTPNVTYEITESSANHTRSFGVNLTSQPIANVVITITNPSVRLSLDKSSLTFTTTNWNTPQSFTLTAVDNTFADGDVLVSVDLSLTSVDPSYSNKFPASISLKVIDNDKAGLTISPDPALSYDVTEGTTKTFSVKLSTQPKSDVTIVLANNHASRIGLDKTSLVYTLANWDTFQTFTVTATNNFWQDGNLAATVGLSVTSEDPIYNNKFATTFHLQVLDNDVAGLTISPNPAQTYDVTEGTTKTFSVKLSSQPTSNVTITLTRNPINDSRFGLDKTSLTYTPSDWDTFQTFTVTAVENNIQDLNLAVTITLNLTSQDLVYNNHFSTGLHVNINNNDVVGMVVSPDATATYKVTEGASQTFSVKLKSQPTANVTITLTRSPINDQRFTLDKTSLIYTSANWNTFQDFTVKTIENTVQEPNLPVTITLRPTSTDGLYNNLTSVALHLNVINDDFYMYFPTVVRDPNPLLYDAFNGSTTNWTLINRNDGATQGVDAGQLLLSHTKASFNTQSISPLPAGFMRPYSVETTAWVPVGGPANTVLGILFDYQDTTHFYRFLIDPTSRTYWLQKYTASGYVNLVPSAVSNAILSGNSRNHLKLIRHAGSIEVYINGQYVTYANDGAFMTGQLGLIMRAPSELLNETTAQARFEDYLVLKVTAPVYQDLFDGATTTWRLTPTATSAIGISEGQLVLSQTAANYNTRAITDPAFNMTNPSSYYRLQADVQLQIASGNSVAGTRLGIIFNARNVAEFYRFLINPTDGTFQLQKYNAGYVDLAVGSSPAIKTGDAVNHLEVVRNGAYIEISINNVKVGSTNDATFSGGDAGFMMVAPVGMTAPITRAYFDNFEAYLK